MQKEQRWALTYVSKKDGQVKTCYPRSEEKKKEQIELCKKNGIEILSCKKLYPFNTYANQHNFELINNICFNTMYDMDSGEIEYNAEEYNRLEKARKRAEEFFCLPLPVAWISWEDWKDAKELSDMAIIHRQECCIANGRYDLVAYC